MVGRRWGWSVAILLALLAGIGPAAAMQEVNAIAGSADVGRPSATREPIEDIHARLDDLRQTLARFDRNRQRELESRYEQSGDPEKRLLERRFGVIEHRFRVNADPYEILRRWEAGLEPKVRDDPDQVLRILEEITEGRYAAYYFFDAVIRPNVFAPEARLERRESTVHEKVHLIQPSVYKALGIRCIWIDPHDPCIQSLEPVAVYLTEYAILKRAAPDRSDVSVNRAIMTYLDLEATRCGHSTPVARCPTARQVTEYMLLPGELAREVARHGLEEGIRRFVAGLADSNPVALGR
jgi:hypothetical protein